MARTPYEQPQERRVSGGARRTPGYQTQGGKPSVTQRQFSRKEMKTAANVAKSALTKFPSEPVRSPVGRGQRPDISPVFKGAHEMVASHLGIESRAPKAIYQQAQSMRRGTA